MEGRQVQDPRPLMAPEYCYAVLEAFDERLSTGEDGGCHQSPPISDRGPPFSAVEHLVSEVRKRSSVATRLLADLRHLRDTKNGPAGRNGITG